MPGPVDDPEVAARLRAERAATGAGRRDEAWDGIHVKTPLPDNEHQELAAELWLVFRSVVRAAGGVAYNAINVSDRDEGWTQNYREPDLAVILPGNPAKDRGTHWQGGPDLVVEILSPGDPARDKRPFYARIGVRELLIVDREPWTLELYRLDAGRLDLVGTSTPDRPAALASAVLPLSFTLSAGPDRPRIAVATVDGGASWLV